MCKLFFVYFEIYHTLEHIFEGDELEKLLGESTLVYLRELSIPGSVAYGTVCASKHVASRSLIKATELAVIVSKSDQITWPIALPSR